MADRAGRKGKEMKRGRPQLYARIRLDCLARQIAQAINRGDTAGERALRELASVAGAPVNPARVQFFRLQLELFEATGADVEGKKYGE